MVTEIPNRLITDRNRMSVSFEFRLELGLEMVFCSPMNVENSDCWSAKGWVAVVVVVVPFVDTL